jgi:hypothetical protein
MALTKIRNSSLDDADLVALAGNDGSALTGVLKTGDIGSTVQGYDADIATTSDITTAVSQRIIYFEQATMPTGVPSGSVWLDTDTGVKAMLNIDNGVDIWVEF